MYKRLLRIVVTKATAFAACRPRDYLAIAQRMRRPLSEQRSVKEAANNIVVSRNDRLARRTTDGAADVRSRGHDDVTTS